MRAWRGRGRGRGGIEISYACTKQTKNEVVRCIRKMKQNLTTTKLEVGNVNCRDRHAKTHTNTPYTTHTHTHTHTHGYIILYIYIRKKLKTQKFK
jgi:hypothetical protein